MLCLCLPHVFVMINDAPSSCCCCLLLLLVIVVRVAACCFRLIFFHVFIFVLCLRAQRRSPPPSLSASSRFPFTKFDCYKFVPDKISHVFFSRVEASSSASAIWHRFHFGFFQLHKLPQINHSNFADNKRGHSTKINSN